MANEDFNLEQLKNLKKVFDVSGQSYGTAASALPAAWHVMCGGAVPGQAGAPATCCVGTATRYRSEIGAQLGSTCNCLCLFTSGRFGCHTSCGMGVGR